MTSMTRSSKNYKEKSVKSANIDDMANLLQNFCQAKLTIRGISLCNIFHRCEYVYIAQITNILLDYGRKELKLSYEHKKRGQIRCG